MFDSTKNYLMVTGWEGDFSENLDSINKALAGNLAARYSPEDMPEAAFHTNRAEQILICIGYPRDPSWERNIKIKEDIVSALRDYPETQHMHIPDVRGLPETHNSLQMHVHCVRA